jgi:2-polyprenyl-3-methyl-5-hydroxy-6-metoxy-1,4-benzoquinol methylase
MSHSDEQWKRLGETDPFWGVLTDEQFRRDNLTEDGLALFYASGEGDIGRFHARLKADFAAPERFSAVLDFGCGVGRLSCALAPLCDVLIGIDVSDGMLAQARAALDQRGYPSVQLCKSVTEALRLRPEFDWVCSYIVLQHIPPDRGYELIDDLLGAVRVGGFLTLHVNVYQDDTIATQNWKGRIHHTLLQLFKLDPPVASKLNMYHYDLTAIARLLQSHGFSAYRLDHENHGGQHGYVISGRKDGKA